MTNFVPFRPARNRKKLLPKICCFLMEFDVELLGNDLGIGDGSLWSSCSDEDTQETSQSSKEAEVCTSSAPGKNQFMKRTYHATTMQEFFCKEAQASFFTRSVSHCCKWWRNLSKFGKLTILKLQGLVPGVAWHRILRVVEEGAPTCCSFVYTCMLHSC